MFGSGRGGICEWFRGLGFDFTNPVGTEGVYDVCQCFGCGVMGGVWGELMDGLGRVWDWFMSVYIMNLDSLCR